MKITCNLAVASLFLTLVFSAAASAPVVPINVDLKAERAGYTVECFQAEDTTIRAYFFTNGVAWTGDTNYTAVLGFGPSPSSSQMVLTTNTFTNTTTFLDFRFTPAQLNTNGTFYSQLMVTDTNGQKWVFDDGRVILKRSPITGGASALTFTQIVDWDLVTSEGTLPWGESGTMDHTALSNLHWSASGHTGTPARIAGFLEGGSAGYIPVGAGLELDGSDNLNVSNAIISGAALGATAVQTETDPIWSGVSNLYYLASNPSGYGVGDVVAANVNAFLATNTAHGFKAAGSDGFVIINSGNSTCVTFGAGGGCSAQFGDGANFAGQVQVSSLNVTNGLLNMGGHVITNAGGLSINADSDIYIGATRDGRIGYKAGLMVIDSTDVTANDNLTISDFDTVTIGGNVVGSGSGTISNFVQAGTFTTNTPTSGQVAKYNATDARWYAADDGGGTGGGSATNVNLYMYFNPAVEFADVPTPTVTQQVNNARSVAVGAFGATSTLYSDALEVHVGSTWKSNIVVRSQFWTDGTTNLTCAPLIRVYNYVGDSVVYSGAVQTIQAASSISNRQWYTDVYTITNVPSTDGRLWIRSGWAATNDTLSTRTSTIYSELWSCEPIY